MYHWAKIRGLPGNPLHFRTDRFTTVDLQLVAKKAGQPLEEANGYFHWMVEQGYAEVRFFEEEPGKEPHEQRN